MTPEKRKKLERRFIEVLATKKLQQAKELQWQATTRKLTPAEEVAVQRLLREGTTLLHELCSHLDDEEEQKEEEPSSLAA